MKVSWNELLSALEIQVLHIFPIINGHIKLLTIYYNILNDIIKISEKDSSELL